MKKEKVIKHFFSMDLKDFGEKFIYMAVFFDEKKLQETFTFSI